jgi:hypothetical protein
MDQVDGLTGWMKGVDAWMAWVPVVVWLKPGNEAVRYVEPALNRRDKSWSEDQGVDETVVVSVGNQRSMH